MFFSLSLLFLESITEEYFFILQPLVSLPLIRNCFFFSDLRQIFHPIIKNRKNTPALRFYWILLNNFCEGLYTQTVSIIVIFYKMFSNYRTNSSLVPIITGLHPASIFQYALLSWMIFFTKLCSFRTHPQYFLTNSNNCIFCCSLYWPTSVLSLCIKAGQYSHAFVFYSALCHFVVFVHHVVSVHHT